MIYNVKVDPILQVSSQEPLMSYKSQTKPDRWILSDLHKTFKMSSQLSTNMIFYVKDDPIFQVFSQEPSTSSKFFSTIFISIIRKFKKMAITPLKMAEMTWLCQSGQFFGWFWGGLFSLLFWFGEVFFQKIDFSDFEYFQNSWLTFFKGACVTPLKKKLDILFYFIKI